MSWCSSSRNIFLDSLFNNQINAFAYHPLHLILSYLQTYQVSPKPLRRVTEISAPEYFPPMRGIEMAPMDIIHDVGKLPGKGLIYTASTAVDAMLKAI
jgi:hypothetical protein